MLRVKRRKAMQGKGEKSAHGQERKSVDRGVGQLDFNILPTAQDHLRMHCRGRMSV